MFNANPTKIQDLRGPGFWYLATPYSHPDEAVRERRCVEAHSLMSRILLERVYIFSPIWAGHHAAIKHNLPTDHLFWWRFNASFMRKSEGLLVAEMEGFNDSKGIAAETAFMLEIGKPIYFVDPEDLAISSY